MRVRQLSAEVVIIGSGAGGATAFERLSRRGIDVLLIEEGEWISPDFLREPIAIKLQRLYRSGGLQPIYGSPPIAYGEGRAVGGSTEVNGGLLWAPPDSVLAAWRERGVLADQPDWSVQTAFRQIERDLGVTDAEHDRGSDVDSLMLRKGALEMGWSTTRARRAVRQCLRSNMCGAGCPTGAKQSMSLTYVPSGIEHGGRVASGVRIHRIVRGNQQRIAHAEGVTRDGQAVRISAKDFFLAAGALHSPRLLASVHRRPQKNRLGLHLNAKIIAEFDEDIVAQNGTIFTEQVQDFIDDGILLMATNLEPEFLSLGLATANDETVQSLWRRIKRLGLYTVQTRPENYGTVLTVGRHSFPHFRLSSADWRQLTIGVAKLSQALFAAGARALYLPLKGIPRSQNLAEVQAHMESARASDWQLTSVHSMSSLPASREPGSSFNQHGRSTQFSNLWVCDASGLPTTVGESPQGSIMLFSDHVSSHFLSSRPTD